MPISAGGGRGRIRASLVTRSPVDSFSGDDRAAAIAARNAAIADTGDFDTNPNLVILLTYGDPAETVYQGRRGGAWADLVGTLRGARGSDADATLATRAAQAAAQSASDSRDDVGTALAAVIAARDHAAQSSQDAAQSLQGSNEARDAAVAARDAALVGRDSAQGSAERADASDMSAGEHETAARQFKDAAETAKDCAVDAQNAAANSATEAICARDDTVDLRDEVKALVTAAKALVVGPIWEAVKGFIEGGTQTGITVTPQDADQTIDFEVDAAPTPPDPDPVMTTDTDRIYMRAADAPDAPMGGMDERVHTPAGWARQRPDATETEGVYEARRTRSYTDGVFQSATAWGNVSLVTRPLRRTYLAQKVGTDFTAADALAGESVIGNTIGTVAASENQNVAVFVAAENGTLDTVLEIDINGDENPFGITRLNFQPAAADPATEIDINGVNYYVYHTARTVSRFILGNISLRLTQSG